MFVQLNVLCLGPAATLPLLRPHSMTRTGVAQLLWGVCVRRRALPQCCCRRYCATRSSSEVRVRFAPSPTGQLHLGGLRTALYNYLFARSHGGKFVLRVEDTDQTRLVPGATEKLIEMLEWAGIGIDEGPYHGGSHGPYLQSQRLDHYWQHIETLLQNGSAYRCFCTSKRLDLLRKDALRRREVPKYDNRCRHLTQEDVHEKLAQNTPYVVRFKLEPYKDPWQDLVYGPIVIDVASIEGDPILLKTDRFPTYHFANVVDDHLMGITHVLRGVEWQNSTTKHVLLYKAFSWKPPQFAHLPLLLNKDGTKLSKRQGDIHVDHFKTTGFFPEAVINLLTIAGSGFDTRCTDAMTLDELVTHFSIDRVNSHSTRIDLHRLGIINQGYIQRKLAGPEKPGLIAEVRRLIKDTLKERLCDDNNLQDEILSDDYIGAVLEWSKSRIQVLEDLTAPEMEFIWVIPSTLDLSRLSLTYGDDVMRTLERTATEVTSMSPEKFATSLSPILRQLAKSHGLKFSSYMQLLRSTISGLKVGPSVVEMMTVLGQENTVRRLQYATSKLPKESIVASR